MLDIVPTVHMFESVDLLHEAYLHWYFLARGRGQPVRRLPRPSDHRSGARLPGPRGDEATRHVEAALLAAWGAEHYVGRHFDVPAAWQQYAAPVRAGYIHADHYLAEENPATTIEGLEGPWKKVR